VDLVRGLPRRFVSKIRRDQRRYRD
jgi:hypothetical protein